MDVTDIKLIQTLRQNSRIPYRELAQGLGLSVNAVHKRIKDMVATGIITEFHTSITYDETEMIGAVIMGRSSAPDMEKTLQRLAKNDRMAQIVVAGGNYLYIVGFLKEIGELDKFTIFSQKEASLIDPIVGIGVDDMPADYKKEKLTTLDYRIALSLRWNSRKEVSDIAQELGVSAKTVHRRLARLVENKHMHFGVDINWAASNDIISLFHMKLHDPAKREQAIARLTNKYKPNFLQCTRFSNFPSLFIATVWTTSMKELREIHVKMNNDGFYESIVPNISYSSLNLDTWSADWLRKQTQPADD